MKIDNELVDKLAELSKLEFDETTREEIKEDLQKMISFVDKLAELDIEGVEPLIYITDEVNVMREDEVKHDISRDDALKNAPLHDSDYIKVPKVLKKG